MKFICKDYPSYTVCYLNGYINFKNGIYETENKNEISFLKKTRYVNLEKEEVKKVSKRDIQEKDIQDN